MSAIYDGQQSNYFHSKQQNMKMECVSRCYNLFWLGLLLMCFTFCIMRECSCQQFKGCNWDFAKEETLRKKAISKENLAVGKLAKISSTYNVSGVKSGPACLAVDGSRNTTYFTIAEQSPNCVSSGKGDSAPFWEVDLKETYNINQIHVYWMELGDENREDGVILQVSGKKCIEFKKPVKNPSEVECNMTGSIVRLSRSGASVGVTSFLGICEVEAWACFPGFFGKYCNVTCIKECEDDMPCHGISGECVKAPVPPPLECTLPIKAAIIAGLSVPLGLIIFILLRLSGSSSREQTTAIEGEPGEEEKEEKEGEEGEEGEGGEGGEEGEKEEGGEGDEAVEEEVASEAASEAASEEEKPEE